MIGLAEAVIGAQDGVFVSHVLHRVDDRFGIGFARRFHRFQDHFDGMKAVGREAAGVIAELLLEGVGEELARGALGSRSEIRWRR